MGTLLKDLPAAAEASIFAFDLDGFSCGNGWQSDVKDPNANDMLEVEDG